MADRISDGFTYETWTDVAGILTRAKKDGDRLSPRADLDSQELWKAVHATAVNQSLDPTIIDRIAKIAAQLPSALEDAERQYPAPDWEKILAREIKEGQAQTPNTAPLRRGDVAFLMLQIEKGVYHQLLTIHGLNLNTEDFQEDELDKMILLKNIGTLTKKWLPGWVESLKYKTPFIQNLPYSIAQAGALAEEWKKKRSKGKRTIPAIKVEPYMKIFLVFMTAIEQEFMKVASANKAISQENITQALGAIGNFYGTLVANADYAFEQAYDRQVGGMGSLRKAIADLVKTGFNTDFLNAAYMVLQKRSSRSN